VLTLYTGKPSPYRFLSAWLTLNFVFCVLCFVFCGISSLARTLAIVRGGGGARGSSPFGDQPILFSLILFRFFTGFLSRSLFPFFHFWSVLHKLISPFPVFPRIHNIHKGILGCRNRLRMVLACAPLVKYFLHFTVFSSVLFPYGLFCPETSLWQSLVSCW